LPVAGRGASRFQDNAATPQATDNRQRAWADEPNHRIYGSVSVVVRPGEEQSKTVTAGGVKMTMKGRVDAERTGAVADVTVVREGVLVSHQVSRVQLARAGRP